MLIWSNHIYYYKVNSTNRININRFPFPHCLNFALSSSFFFFLFILCLFSDWIAQSFAQSFAHCLVTCVHHLQNRSIKAKYSLVKSYNWLIGLDRYLYACLNENHISLAQSYLLICSQSYPHFSLRS